MWTVLKTFLVWIVASYFFRRPHSCASLTLSLKGASQNNKKVRQCTCNVTLLQWKSNKYYIRVCVCSLSHPARNAHALYSYCHRWHARFYIIFPHYLIKDTIFEKKKVFEYKMCVLIFYTVWKIYNSKNNSAKYDKKCILVFVYSTRYSCQILMKLEFSRQIFENTLISNFMKICLVGAEFHEGRWTDGQARWR